MANNDVQRAIVTFEDPKNWQKIIVNLTLENDELDVKVKFDPTVDENKNIGLIGFLSQLFLTSLKNEGSDITEGDSR